MLLTAAMPASVQATAAVCPPPAASAEDPTAAQPGEAVIACIGSRPLAERTFEHWHEVAATGASGERHLPTPQELIERTMGFLLSAAWVQGEAQALGVHVSAVAVNREFKRIRHAQFPRRRDFQRFLKKSKETVADLLMRVELDMLSSRIQHRVTAGHHGTRAKQRALASFAAHFREKWTGKTYCAPRYAMPDCGHVQSNL